MIKPRMLSPLVLVLLSGCSGTLTTHSDDDGSKSYEGIRFYPTVLAEEISKTTRATSNGKLIGTDLAPRASPEYCAPIFSSKYLVAADFDHPKIMSYKPGLLESYTFGATLTDGMLTIFNTQSTPDQGKTFNNVATPITQLAGALVQHEDTKAKTPTLACNDGSIVVSRVCVKGCERP